MSMVSKSKDVRKRTIPNDAITPEVLHGHFEKNKVFREGKYKPPNKKALHELAEKLEVLRGIIQSRPDFIESHNRGLDFIRGISFFHDCLPNIIATHHNLEKYLDHAEVQREIKALKELQSAVERVKEEMFPRFKWAPIDDRPAGKEKKPDTFQDHAWLLVGMFRTALRPTNPDVDIMLSNHGPISRFLEVIFPLVTGESVVGENVMRWLQLQLRTPDI